MRGVLTRLRATRLWSRLRDRRHLRRHRAQQRFIAGFIGPGALVFDIGANVGHYTLLAQSLGARVVAVEPQAALAAHLRRRFGGSPGVAVVNCAVGTTAGTATLHKTADLSEVASLRGDIGARSRFARDHPYTLSESVAVLTLEDLITRHGCPDFCKIDVEGHESAVLAGLRTPLAGLSFEFNREFRDDTARCLAQLSALAPYRFNFALGEANELAEPAWLEASAAEAALWSRPDPLLWGDLYARLSPPGPATLSISR